MESSSNSLAQGLINIYNLKPRKTKETEFKKIYTLPLQPIYRDEENRLRICQLGYTKDDDEVFNILVIGTTGSGKSTAINALINYITGVEYEDPFRLEIVSLEESEKSAGSQANSQTDWVTVYKIGVMGNSKLNFQVNIVDTPGFADTGDQKDNNKDKGEGPNEKKRFTDKERFNQLKLLFTNCLTNVNAVCITLNGTIERLTSEQEYVFDTLTQVFGKDIVRNLFILATFKDPDEEKEPEVLTAVKAYGIKYVDYFSFENGALYKPIPKNERTRTRDKDRFEEAWSTFDSFFKETSKVESQSLEDSRKVLEERNRLREEQSSIERDIQQTLVTLKAQKDFEKQIQELGDTISKEEKVKFTVKLEVSESGKFFNCEKCKMTCCDPCNHSSLRTLFVYDCANLQWDNYCPKCRCHADSHDWSKLKKYSLVEKSLSEIENIQKQSPEQMHLTDAMKKNIEEAKNLCKGNTDRKQEKERILTSHKKKIDDLENGLRESLKSLRQSLDSLQKIALYQEKQTVKKILEDIQKNDTNKDHLDIAPVYERLKDFIKTNNL